RRSGAALARITSGLCRGRDRPPRPVVIQEVRPEPPVPGETPAACLLRPAPEPSRLVGPGDPVRAGVSQAPPLGTRADRTDGRRLSNSGGVLADDGPDGARLSRPGRPEARKKAVGGAAR